MLKVWGRINSLNVQKAMFCIEELGIPYERFDAGMSHGVVQTPEYKAMNPNSVVPTIDDDGFILWESNVIVRYLAAKHSPGGLWPTDLKTRADLDRWMDWQQTSFHPPLTTLFWRLVRTPNAADPGGELDAARVKIKGVTAILEARLQGRRLFLGGEAFTMADCIMAVPGVHRWLNIPSIERRIPISSAITNDG